MTGVVISKQIIDFRDIPAYINDSSKPIVFWDTCSLLYFNSIVDRRAYNEYEWDEKLLNLIETGQVFSVTSMVVLKEFNKHHDDLFNKDTGLENSLRNAMGDYGNIVGSPQKEDLQKGMAALNLAAHLDGMVTKLWLNTYVIDENLFFHEKAHNRVLAEQAPAKEKQEYKDCYIWETFLTLCDQVAQKDRTFFMTENTVDYCGKKSTTPLADIANDLKGRGGHIQFRKSRLYVDVAKMLGIIA